MKWNWQHRDWPNFRYDPKRFIAHERQFFENAGIIQGSLKHLNEADEDKLRVEIMAEEALKTSEIEGEMLSRESLQSSIRKHFGMKADRRKISAAEQGITEMMVDLYKNYKRPLKHEHLFEWHKMLTNGRRDLVDIGRYRTHEDAMQIVSGQIDNPRVHFEAPPSRLVKSEMHQFVKWFNASKGLNLLVRSAVAHIYFESIHPFEDGNGRIGRAISELSISQDLGRPTLFAISHTIQAGKKAYYDKFHQNSNHLEINEWIEYFCQVILKSQTHTQEIIHFLIEKTKFYQQFSNNLNGRQLKVIERIFREGINGFKGGLSAENYMAISGAPRATTTRDLKNLVDQGVLSRTGEKKSTRYYLNLSSAIKVTG